MIRHLIGVTMALAASMPAQADETSPRVDGMFRYMADAALFQACDADDALPVAMEGAYIHLERAYSDAVAAGHAEPGAPLLASITGAPADRPAMEGDGIETAMVVARFVHLWPGERCERWGADAPLPNTYWKIIRIGDLDFQPVESARAGAHMVLRTDGTVAATAGCNRLAGGFAAEGTATEGKLGFGPAMSTKMACPGPLDAREQALGTLLSAAAAYEISGNALEVFDADGTPLALFQAVALP